MPPTTHLGLMRPSCPQVSLRRALIPLLGRRCLFVPGRLRYHEPQSHGRPLPTVTLRPPSPGSSIRVAADSESSRHPLDARSMTRARPLPSNSTSSRRRSGCQIRAVHAIRPAFPTDRPSIVDASAPPLGRSPMGRASSISVARGGLSQWSSEVSAWDARACRRHQSPATDILGNYMIGPQQAYPSPPSPEAMTIDDLEDTLQVSSSSLDNLAQDGTVPSQKVGRHWHFCRETIVR